MTDTTDSDVRAPQAERQALWFLGRSATLEPLTAAEVERFDTAQWRPDFGPQQLLEEMREVLGSEEAFSIESTEHGSGTGVEIVVAGPDGRRWLAACEVQAQEPHRIERFWFRPAPPPGTVIRQAVPDDGAALASLELRSPLRLGDVRLSYDRGDDYFAPARRAENLTILVALVDGVHAGVYWGAVQHVFIGGEPRKLLLENHVRVLPEFQRGGVFWTLVATVRGMHAPMVDSIAFYVSPLNERIRRHIADVPHWKAQPVRAILNCADVAGGDEGRVSEPADAAEIADILNACHAYEELFVPYSAASLTSRLERSPEQYGWAQMRVADGAAVGVASDVVGVIRERESDSWRSQRATAIDHGFVPGADDAYRALLRRWCAELSQRGVTELAVFTSAGSSSYPVLVDLATDLELFDFWSFEIEEPEGAAERGFYVDPVYF